MAKTVGGVTTLFLVDDRNATGYAQVLEEHVSVNSQPPALYRTYSYGNDLISQDQLLANGNGGSTWLISFYGYDGHGNARYLSDPNGNVTDTYDYDAFGDLIAQSFYEVATPNSYLYCGEQFDSDLGLYYNRARYLNTDSGRFWTMDTFDGTPFEPTSLQKFAYGSGEPVGNIDPSGNSLLAEWMQSSSISVNLRKNQTQDGYKKARRIAARLCQVAAKLVGPYNRVYEQITKYSPFQAHHVDQNALMGAISLDYEKAFGFAVALLGGSHLPGSPHDMATTSQASNKGKSLRFIKYEASPGPKTWSQAGPSWL